MTTLPQTTTTVRMPRQIAGGQLATNQGGVPALAVPTGSGGSMTGNDVWRVLRVHVWLIFGMLICSGVLGYVANYFLAKHYSRYTAVGLLSVNPVAANPDILSKGNNNVADPGSVSLEAKSQAQILKSEGLLTRVLLDENSKIRKTTWFKKFNNSIALAKDDFYDNFSVTPLPETNLLRIEFSNRIPEECKDILAELVDKHIKDQQEDILMQTKSRGSELTSLNNRLRAKMSANEATLAQYRSTLNNEGGPGGLGRISIKEMELDQLMSAKTSLEFHYQALQADLDQDQKNLAAGIEPAEAVEKAQQDPQLYQLRAEEMNLRQQLQLMADSLGPKSTKFQSTEKLYNNVKQEVANTESEVRLRFRNSVLEKKRQMAQLAKNDFDLMQKRVEELQASLGELSNTVAKYYSLLEEDKGLRERAKQASDQLDNLATLQNIQMNGRVNWRAYPVEPTNRSFPKLGLTMTLALAVGLMLSLGIAFLREVTDTSIRNERDIARVGTMTLLGMIADESDDPQAAGARLPLVIFDAPHSMTAEQLRQVRTRLQHAASLDTTRSIMITSAAPGDGKTTIACNLAAGLALNGRRILLVDGNFRRPEIHRVFGLGNEQGFSDVLNGAVAFEDVVHETQVPNLAVMASGPKPINATEMFESQLLIDFIERALEEFDHVIFDTGPMMVVSESAAMAPRVDGVVTVARARGSNRGQLTRMVEGLRATKAEHLGVVLNGVRAQGGGYYRRNIKTYYEYQNG